ncbi:hypothetical protein HPB48_018879 [Haemaphysalis longicornis]|uniref:Cytochrome P450 n=1 Tax=Haemaphysalis longicornis TaxID=44386 RepID=A0A9J6GRX4_HAELO|nr:hypothetical protein HPB48_018879 [Haemaphysalis longicornis]
MDLRNSGNSSVYFRSSEDVVIDGYFIPKGTTVIPNIWACHNDPGFWEDPHKYSPERFLNDDGKLSQKPEQLIPFSIGEDTLVLVILNFLARGK